MTTKRGTPTLPPSKNTPKFGGGGFNPKNGGKGGMSKPPRKPAT